MSTESSLAIFERQGASALGAIDLMAILLSNQESDVPAATMIARDIVVSQGLNRLGQMTRKDLEKNAAIEGHLATRLLAAIELGRKIGQAGRGEVVKIESARDAYIRLKHLVDLRKEVVCGLFLDSKGGVLAEKVVHIGTATMSIVGPREIFLEAVREGAASLIVAHNHPSGDPTPSREDIEVTKKLAEVGEILDIPLLDHIVVGQGRYASMKELGYL